MSGGFDRTLPGQLDSVAQVNKSKKKGQKEINGSGHSRKSRHHSNGNEGDAVVHYMKSGFAAVRVLDRQEADAGGPEFVPVKNADSQRMRDLPDKKNFLGFIRQL